MIYALAVPFDLRCESGTCNDNIATFCYYLLVPILDYVIPWVMWSLYSLINQISIVDSCQRSPEQFLAYINMDMNGTGMTKLCACCWHVTRSQNLVLCIAINFMYKSLNDDNIDLNVFMKTLSYCNSFCCVCDNQSIWMVKFVMYSYVHALIYVLLKSWWWIIRLLMIMYV